MKSLMLLAAVLGANALTLETQEESADNILVEYSYDDMNDEQMLA